ncbi:hypothetical protein D082_06260 [Synechocystis sp. PCC 6714]|nr:hypothetical protein D082_06260 [Synechocystis sp. PCC 6714]
MVSRFSLASYQGWDGADRAQMGLTTVGIKTKQYGNSFWSPIYFNLKSCFVL